LLNDEESIEAKLNSLNDVKHGWQNLMYTKLNVCFEKLFKQTEMIKRQLYQKWTNGNVYPMLWKSSPQKIEFTQCFRPTGSKMGKAVTANALI
jgi:hypothetical protein